MFWITFTTLYAVCRGNVRFVAYGDWGDNTSQLKNVADTVRKYAPDRDFTLLMGDNFYPAGVSSVNDPQFKIFPDIVAAGNSAPHHLVLGNHDYMASVSAQIAYSDVDSRWDLPSRYYVRTYSKGGATVCVVFIDTEVFDSTQTAWIDSVLSTGTCASPQTWRIVCGHRPIWSAGLYGDRDELKAELLPILHARDVSLYLSGHDHLHEVFYDGQLVSMVSAASGQVRSALQFQPHNLQIWGLSGTKIHGYVDATVTSSEIRISIVSAKNGRDFQSFAITKGGNKQSMFGNINWSRQDSNKDAYIADLPSAPVDVTTTTSSPATTGSSNWPTPGSTGRIETTESSGTTSVSPGVGTSTTKDSNYLGIRIVGTLVGLLLLTM
jgi:tartrate-resistant acid phosphatase type 5